MTVSGLAGITSADHLELDVVGGRQLLLAPLVKGAGAGVPTAAAAWRLTVPLPAAVDADSVRAKLAAERAELTIKAVLAAPGAGGGGGA